MTRSLTAAEPWTAEQLLAQPGLRAKPEWLGQAQPLSPALAAAFSLVAVVLVGLSTTLGLVAGLALIAGLAAALAILRYPVLGGYALVALVPICSGLRRGFPVPGLRISEVLVAVIAVLVLLPAQRRSTPRWGVVDWTGFAYATLAALLPTSHLVGREESVNMSSVASAFLPLQFFLLYRTVRAALGNRTQRDTATRLLLFASLIVAALAVVQQLNIGPARALMLSITGSDALDSYGYSVYARATGPFQHWHPLAGYLCVILLLCVALLLDSRQAVMTKRSLVVVTAAAGAALMLSVTFVSMIGVVVGAAILGARARKFREAVVVITGGGLVAMALFGSFVLTRLRNQYDDGVGGTRTSLIPQTIQYRIDVWTEQYLPGMGGRWAAGWGPDLPPDATWTHTESVYITLALRGGIPLLAAFVLSMVAITWTMRRLDVDITRQPLARTLAALVVVLWFMQLLSPYSTSSGMPQPFFALLGITLAGWHTNGQGWRPEPGKTGAGF